jgi:hypothetical protein
VFFMAHSHALPPFDVDIDTLPMAEVRAMAERELRRRARISKTKTGGSHNEATRRKIGESRKRAWAERKARKAAS